MESREDADISFMQIAKQARIAKGQKLFQIVRQQENEAYIASKGSVELERLCQELMQEVELVSGRQEVLAGLMEDKIRIQNKTTEKYYETIFEELSELEEKRSKEVLALYREIHFGNVSK